MTRRPGIGRLVAGLDRIAVALAQRWQLAAPRDRRALLAGGALALVIGVAGISTSITERERAIDQRIAQKQQLLRELPTHLAAARRLQRLGAEASLPLLTLAGRIVAAAGLTADIQPTADGGARLRLDAVPADAVVELLADAAALQLHTRSMRLESATPGRVNLLLELGPRGS